MGSKAMDVIMAARNPSAGDRLREALARVDKDLVVDIESGIKTVPLHVAICHGCSNNVKIILEVERTPTVSIVLCFSSAR